MFDPLALTFRLGDITIWHKDPCLDGTDDSCKPWHDGRRSWNRIPWRWHFWHWRVHSHRFLRWRAWAFERCDACQTPMRYAIQPQRFESGTTLCRPGCWGHARLARENREHFAAQVAAARASATEEKANG